VRVKLEQFEVENPKEAMEKFRKALTQVVKVPKAMIERKRKQAKARRIKKRNR